MNTHQQRLGRKARKQQEQQAKARDKAARRRDMPYYLKHDLGRVDGDLRVDRMPDIVRVRGEW